ncbi:STAS domain-containing protein [Streptomyces sp. CC219B]|uniref:STAS domain-containing protein n=1 Tax=Streptomyces sp. CC219B TaxID=3044574 RepID=UPI0024A8A57A|nr:STAS domain-containing protein [Streptomyces sp. CC219B]
MRENLTPAAPPLMERVVAETTVVELHGELDLWAASLLTARLDALTAGPCPDLVLDLRDVSFVDCSGLAVLCRARTRALARHGRVRLVTASPHFLRLLRLTGLAGVFELYASLPNSLSTTPARATASVTAG